MQSNVELSDITNPVEDSSQKKSCWKHKLTKNQRIFIVIASLVVLGGIIGGAIALADMLIQQRIDEAVKSATINMESIEVLNTDRSLKRIYLRMVGMKIGFTVDTPVKVLILPFAVDITESGNLLGRASTTKQLEILPGEQESQFDYMDLWLDLSDLAVFDSFVSRFLSTSKMDTQLSGLLTLQFVGFSGLFKKAAFTKTIQLPGLSNFSTVSLHSFDFMETFSSSDFIMNFKMIYNNPSFITINVVEFGVDMYYNGSRIGNATVNGFEMVRGMNYFNVIGKIDNLEDIAKMAKYMVDGKSATVRVNGSFASTFNGLVSPHIAYADLDMVIPGNTFSQIPGAEDIIQSIKLHNIAINIFGPVVNADATATIKNILNFPIQLQSCEFDIRFDDVDGYLLYGPKYNIGLGQFTKAFSPPLNLTANGNTTVTESLAPITNYETAVRLNHEYNTKNDLKINLVNGKVKLRFYSFGSNAFNWEIPFSIYNEPVS